MASIISVLHDFAKIFGSVTQSLPATDTKFEMGDLAASRNRLRINKELTLATWS
jgi:hypothetical protein